MAIDANRLKELGERTLQCTVTHDWEGLREQYADDAVWHTPNAPLLSQNLTTLIEGGDAIIEFYKLFTEGLQGAQFEPLACFTGCDLHVQVWRLGSRVGVDVTRFGPDEKIIEQFDVLPERSTLTL